MLLYYNPRCFILKRDHFSWLTTMSIPCNPFSSVIGETITPSQNNTYFHWPINNIEVLPIMFLLHQVITGSKCYEMSVVSGSRDGHTAGTSHIRVTELVGQHLKFIGIEVIVIPQNMVVRGSTGTLRIQH